MKADQFCYWLQGHFELSEEEELSKDQVEMIKRHLSLVFAHDLDAEDPDGSLQSIHDGESEDVGDKILYRC